MTDHPAGSPPAPDLSTKLALERTRIAYERTMMSWVRTATALITFGFSVYKFFQFELSGKGVTSPLIGPREFGLVLIGIGLLSLFLGTIEHGRDLRALRKQYPGMPRSMTRVVTIPIAALGVLAFLTAIVRV